MKRIALPTMFLGVLLLCFNGLLFASAAGELRERAKALQTEASATAENGNKDLGGRLESESKWLLEAAERLEGRPDISAAGELRERAKALRTEASAIAEQGNKDVGGRLESESAWLLEAAERLELAAKDDENKVDVENVADDKVADDKVADDTGDRPDINNVVARLQKQLDELLAKERKMKEAKAAEHELGEVREQISRTQRQLKEIHAHLTHAPHERSGHRPEFRAQTDKLRAAARRVHHMRVAAENLKMAEVHDLARQLTEKAEAMEREVQEGHRRLAAEMHEVQRHRVQGHRGEQHQPDAIRQLQEEIQRLRSEVKELRERTENR